MISALAVTGPTASGKTRLSVDLAISLGCEIISCDSMQIYRGMDIGTAKVTREEMRGVPHHMIDIADPWQSYSAENYREDAIAAARDITGRGKIPLFVGGTGLYLDTLVRGTSPLSPPSDPELSARLLREGDSEEGKRELYRRLIETDPESAEKTHPNNLRRVVRALEIYELTGKTKSYFDRLSREGEPDIGITTVCLDFHNRDLLYSRIDERVDNMLRDGLLIEVSRLVELGMLEPNTTAGGAIGYKELFGYLRGECSLDDAREEIKLASRRYAKRQLTWFRNKTRATVLYLDTPQGQMRDYDIIFTEARNILEANI